MSAFASERSVTVTDHVRSIQETAPQIEELAAMRFLRIIKNRFNTILEQSILSGIEPNSVCDLITKLGLGVSEFDRGISVEYIFNCVRPTPYRSSSAERTFLMVLGNPAIHYRLWMEYHRGNWVVKFQNAVFASTQ